MSSFRIRPRFQVVVPETSDVVLDRIRHRLETCDCPCIGSVTTDFANIKIIEEEQHFWSPELSLMLEEDRATGGTLIRGTYGPHPNVWAMFAYGYAIIGILLLFLLCWVTAMWMLGKDTWTVWLIPVLAGAGVLLYLTAQAGQKLGVEQTFTLHHFFEETVHQRTHIS